MTHPVVYIATGVAALLGAAVAFFAERYITQQISNSPYSSSNESKNSDNNWQFIDTSSICSICHDNCQQNGAHLSCGHVFHKRCIQRWFHNSNKGICPNCNKSAKIV